MTVDNRAYIRKNRPLEIKINFKHRFVTLGNLQMNFNPFTGIKKFNDDVLNMLR